MIDNIGARDKIAFVLNGKPVQPTQPKLDVCPVCGVDAKQQPLQLCPKGGGDKCPMSK